MSLAISSQGSIAVAQDICGCNRVVPYPGSYRIDFPEKVGRPGVGGANVEVSDMGGVLGAFITASAPGGGSLTLECRPDGGFTGFMQPMNQPSRITAGVIGALAGGFVGVNGNVPTGLSMTSEFNVIVVRPNQAAAAAALAAANEEMEPTLMFSREAGAGQMPLFICDRVEQDIKSAETLMAAYSNPDLIDKAIEDGLAALNVLPQIWPTYDGLGSYTSKNADITYDQRAKLFALDDEDAAIIDGDLESGNVDRVASTDPETCEITPPSERDNLGRCRLSIVIDAFMAHEQVHRENCLRAKKESGDENGYLYWGNYPPNHSADETEAYLETLAVLEPWFEANCGG